MKRVLNLTPEALKRIYDAAKRRSAFDRFKFDFAHNTEPVKPGLQLIGLYDDRRLRLFPDQPINTSVFEEAEVVL